MTGKITVPAQEHGIVRLFALPYKTAMEIVHGETLGPLEKALGVAYLDPDHVQIVAPSDLGDLGLIGLLEDGHGIARAALAPDRARLAGLTSHVAILRSLAFAGAAHTLHPEPEYPLVASYREEAAAPVRFDTLTSAGATGTTDADTDADNPPEDLGHRASRRTLLIAVAAASLLMVVLLLARGAIG